MINATVSYVRVSVSNAFAVVPSHEAMELGDKLFAETGEVPKMENVDADGNPVGLQIPANLSALKPTEADAVAEIVHAAIPVVDRTIENISLQGKLRSLGDLTTAREMGFAPARPVYERGTIVNDIGVANAKKARAEYDAMPLVHEYTTTFETLIESEERTDKTGPAASMRITPEGDLGFTSSAQTYLLTTRGLHGALARTTCPGGFGYIERCPAYLRAANFNHWAQDLETKENEGLKEGTDRLLATVRLRKNGNRQEVFGVVSDRYQALDVNRVAAAIRAASPSEARGTVTYDGYKALFTVLFHTNVQPEDFVAGEFFRGGLHISTDDTGGGALKVSAVMYQNLCRNLIIIDEAKKPLAVIRHFGQQEMVDAFNKALTDGMKLFDTFLKQWGYASHDSILDYVPEGTPVSKAFEGIFNGLLERELVSIPGRKATVIPELQRMVAEDTSYAGQTASRATVVNALTRYAHTVNQDPWVRSEIEREAGALVMPSRNKKVITLPFESYEPLRK